MLLHGLGFCLLLVFFFFFLDGKDLIRLCDAKRGLVGSLKERRVLKSQVRSRKKQEAREPGIAETL